MGHRTIRPTSMCPRNTYYEVFSIFTPSLVLKPDSHTNPILQCKDEKTISETFHYFLVTENGRHRT